MNIVNRRQLMSDNLSDRRQVPNIRARKILAGVTFAVLIDRCKIIRVGRIAYRGFTPRCEQGAVSRITRRHDAVKHIHPPFDAFEDILRSSNSHEITRLMLR